MRNSHGFPIVMIFTSMIVLLILMVSGSLLWSRFGRGSSAVEQAAPENSPQPVSAEADSVLQKSSATTEEWQAAPPCANSPLGVKEWHAMLASSGNGTPPSSYLQRAALLVGADAQAMTAQPDGPEEYQALLLNIASGRLNRATGIALPEYPDLATVGDLLDRLEAQGAGRAVRQIHASAAIARVLNGEAVQSPVCARLVILQSGGSLNPVVWAKTGVQTQSSAALAGPANGLAAVKTLRFSLDSGMASPDGRWAAYTSLSRDAGGPIFLQNLQNGAWTNLMEAMNAARAPDQAALSPSDWWTVIRWFPDSRRLLIGRSDASSVMVVDLDLFKYQLYPFPGEGAGGSFVTDLAPDGSGFAFIGYGESDVQDLSVYRFVDGQASVLLKQPLNSGVLYFPRFSPDGRQIAYLVQQGSPQTGLSYAIHVLSLAEKSSQELVPGNVGMTVPMWSPDGQYIAYTRAASGAPDVVKPGEAPAPQSVNVWVAQVATGQQLQVTAVQGWARSPVWSTDATTLAFVTQNGEAGMATLYQPGRMWLAAQTSPEFPLLTSLFFVP